MIKFWRKAQPNDRGIVAELVIMQPIGEGNKRIVCPVSHPYRHDALLRRQRRGADVPHWWLQQREIVLRVVA